MTSDILTLGRGDLEPFVEIGYGYGRSHRVATATTSASAFTLGGGVAYRLTPRLRVGARIAYEGTEMWTRDGFLFGDIHLEASALVTTRLGSGPPLDTPQPASPRPWFVAGNIGAGWIRLPCSSCPHEATFGLGAAGGARIAPHVALGGTLWGHVVDHQDWQAFVGPAVEVELDPVWARAAAGVGYAHYCTHDGGPASKSGIAYSLELGWALETVHHRTTELVARGGYLPNPYSTSFTITAGIGVHWR